MVVEHGVEHDERAAVDRDALTVASVDVLHRDDPGVSPRRAGLRHVCLESTHDLPEFVARGVRVQDVEVPALPLVVRPQDEAALGREQVRDPVDAVQVGRVVLVRLQ